VGEPDRQRAVAIVDAIRALGEYQVHVLGDGAGLARCVAEVQPHLVRIEVSDTSSDRQELTLTSCPTERMRPVLVTAIVPIPDEKTGEVVRASVVKNPAFAGDLTVSYIIRHCKALLTDDKVPRSPISKTMRKYLKAEVRAEFQH
jgi:acyl-CoA synthetase (AMP-forming)/AMP-acid ligase II